MTHCMGHIWDNPVSRKPKIQQGLGEQCFTKSVSSWGHSYITKDLLFKRYIYIYIYFSKVKMEPGVPFKGNPGGGGFICNWGIEIEGFNTHYELWVILFYSTDQCDKNYFYYSLHENPYTSDLNRSVVRFTINSDIKLQERKLHWKFSTITQNKCLYMQIN